MHRTLPSTRGVSDAGAVGLHIQHGCERCNWHHTEPVMELVRHLQVQEDWQILGSVARSNCRVDHFGHELGVVRLCSLRQGSGRARALACRNCGANNLVVQLSTQGCTGGPSRDGLEQ